MRVAQLALICKTGCISQGCEHVLQENTLPTAESKGLPWSMEELEFLLDTLDEPLAEVAITLGRTYYATSRARSLYKRGILKI